jgi:hypothetical protein
VCSLKKKKKIQKFLKIYLKKRIKKVKCAQSEYYTPVKVTPDRWLIPTSFFSICSTYERKELKNGSLLYRVSLFPPRSFNNLKKYNEKIKTFRE